MRRIRLSLVGFAIVGLVASVTSQSPVSLSGDAKRFLGTWRLVETTTDGKPDPNRGLHPVGLIYYDATGHMAAQISPEGRRRAFAGTFPTPDEAQAALRGYTAYFGTYAVDERTHTITHDRDGNLNPGGLGPFVRRYEFLPGDQLVLSPMENQNRLVWERIK